jgi:hypothetical protein
MTAVLMVAVHGQIQGVFILGHAQVDQWIQVADTDVEAILGMDFLSENQCQLDCQRASYTLEKEGSTAGMKRMHIFFMLLLLAEKCNCPCIRRQSLLEE